MGPYPENTSIYSTFCGDTPLIELAILDTM